MFSVITNIYNKKIKGPTLMELFTATGKHIDAPMLTSVRLELEYHIDVCRVTHGKHRTSLVRFSCGCEQFY
jgi:hypothetical protein